MSKPVRKPMRKPMRKPLRKRLQKRLRDFLYWYRCGNSVREAWLLARITL